MTPARIVSVAVACVLLAHTPLRADDGKGNVTESIRVERAETSTPRHATLRFLKDNREFLRAQLDRLRVSTLRERATNAVPLDERYLRLAEMAAAIAAARDTVAVEHSATIDRDLLESVTELGDIEAQLDLMERLLAEQRARLLELETDFLGQQETAMVILLRGGNGSDAPATIVVSEGNESVRVSLDDAQRATLARGGITQIYHEFVEPRMHNFTVRFERGQSSTSPPLEIAVDAARDRLTFLELTMGTTAAAPATSVWHR